MNSLEATLKSLKVAAERLAKWEERLIKKEVKLEDREKTLRTSYLEVKGLNDKANSQKRQ